LIYNLFFDADFADFIFKFVHIRGLFFCAFCASLWLFFCVSQRNLRLKIAPLALISAICVYEFQSKAHLSIEAIPEKVKIFLPLTGVCLLVSPGTRGRVLVIARPKAAAISKLTRRMQVG
jgi:hypothetical protein